MQTPDFLDRFPQATQLLSRNPHLKQISAGFTILLAILSIGHQVVRATLQNPVNALKEQ